METLLSEGQLNCAVVSLILALSTSAGPGENPGPKVLALDDPFVSWDDINMENFMETLRHLATNGTVVLLSACDQRVVHSFRQNLETADLKKPALIYTFTGWDKRTGPSVEKTRVERRSSKVRYLSELPPSEFEGNPLRSPVEVPVQPDLQPSPGKSSSRPALYYILTTRNPDCHDNLLKDYRFDHLYLGQPDTRALLDRLANVSRDQRPDVYFIYYNRVPGDPERYQLGDVYRLLEITPDGYNARGHQKYSLHLKRTESLKRPFLPGTALWESLWTTRGKTLKDFFMRTSRVLIPISEQEYYTILGLR